MEKSGLEKISALRLLSCLSEETKLLIYRDLNSLCEESFTGKLRGKVVTEKETEKLKLLEAIEKEQSEQPKKEERMLE